MPLGLVTDAEFESQLENVQQTRSDKCPVVIPIADTKIPTEPVLEGEVVETKSRGRSIGDVNVPSTLRSLIAGTAAIEGRPAALALASEFGVSASSVSAYSKGATSTTTYDKPQQSIIEFVKARKARVTKKALRVMTSALDNLTDDKLSGADAKDLSSIAKDMSAIVGHFNDNTTTINNGGPTFVLFTPPVMQESSFKVISANE